MKKKLLTFILIAIVALASTACSSPPSDDQVEVTQEETEELEEDEDILLSFGFTPEEYKEDFSNFASFSGIEVSDFKNIVSATWYMKATLPDGNEYSFTIMSNSDGKVGSISISNLDEAGSFDVAKAAISAIDMKFDIDETMNELGLPSIPQGIEDSKLITKYGISITFMPTSFTMIRDKDTADQYDYMEIHSNSKSEAENTTSDESASTPASTATMGQLNALSKAHDYLDYSAFSYTGLIGQLEYEGYSKEESTYAVDNCGADWNAQAAKKAQEYLDYSSFSRQGLIDQLKYEGFTAEQAEHGVSTVGY